MKVREIMTTQVVKVSPNSTVKEIAGLLNKYATGAVVVVDQQDRPVGIVGDSELFVEERRIGIGDRMPTLFGELVSANELREQYEAAGDIQAHQVMRAVNVTVDVDDDLSGLLDVMTNNRLPLVPVMEKGKVVGLAKRRDLVLRMFEVA
jgi:CBS domain-containing protein